jgi:homoserine O-acetyltransferase
MSTSSCARTSWVAAPEHGARFAGARDGAALRHALPRRNHPGHGPGPERLLDALGVRKLKVVIGGSIGGQQALEWAVEVPGFVGKAVPIASNAALGPMGLGMSEIGRRAVMADPDWQDGDYHGTGRAPDDGLAIARMAGMMTYQSAPGQWERFGRKPASRPRAVPGVRRQVRGRELPALPGQGPYRPLRSTLTCT